MNTDVQMIPLNLLHRSSLNVRKTGGAKVEDLAASIRARGLIHNLIVFPRPLKGRHGGYEVAAGKRRLAALRLLAKRKQMPTDAAIRCRVVPREEATSASLAENVHREAMHPADQFAAFAKLVDEGKSAEDVAAEFGVSCDTVHKRLRLARVSPQVMALYRADELNLEQVMAFTLTDDHAAQDALLEDNSRPWAGEIRRRLTETSVRGDDPRARFVGRKAYLTAGGSIRRDLFGSGHDAGYFEDAALLDRLVTEKLERVAAKLRQRLPWVEIVGGRIDYGVRSQYGRVPTIRQEPDARTARRLEQLREQLSEAQQTVQALDQQGGDDDEADRAWLAADARSKAIADKIAAIEDTLTVPDPEATAQAGALVALDHRGRVEIIDGLIRPEDKRKTRAVKAEAAEASDIAEAGTFKDPKAVRYDLSCYLTAIVQEALTNNLPLALRALAFQLTLGLRGEGGAGHGIAVAATDHADLGPSQTLAGSAIEQARRERQASWERVLPEEADALWTWCREANDHMVLSLLAYCTARSFDAVQRHGDEQSARPLLSALGLNMGEHWAPNADYFKRIRKADTLAILGAHGHDGPALAKLKRDALAESAANLLAKSRWLPPTFILATG